MPNKVVTRIEEGVYYEAPKLNDDQLMKLCQLNAEVEATEVPNKERALIRLDEDVLSWFKSRAFAVNHDGNFCQLINDALREYASSYKNQKIA